MRNIKIYGADNSKLAEKIVIQNKHFTIEYNPGKPIKVKLK